MWKNRRIMHGSLMPLIQIRIIKNGKGDLAVMSIEAYEELTSRFELYNQMKESMDDIASGNTRSFADAMADIRSKRHE